jgi:hypothetical protein
LEALLFLVKTRQKLILNEEIPVPHFKMNITILTVALLLCCNLATAATFTSCFKNTCAIITTPDHVVPEEAFEIQVEGYIENATGWDNSSYLLLEDAEWHYDSNHMIRFSGETVDAKGLNWGGSLTKKYQMKGLADTKVLTFVFGSRSHQHGYYDVAVEATIEAASPAINVAFDIKPQSCPNPLNVNKKGLLSAAIVGSSDFDVRQVNPATVLLAGVSPIHYSYEDVTEPFYPLTEKVYEFDCTDAGPDGQTDLTLKFRAQEIYDALQNLYGQDLRKGDAVTIQMTAVLSDGVLTNISGEDVLRINSKK